MILRQQHLPPQRPRSPRRFLVLALLPVFLTAVLPDLQAASTLGSIRSDPRSKIDVEVTQFYDELPLQGYQPLLIRISNGTERDHVYQLRTTSFSDLGINVEMEQQLNSEAGSTQEYQVLAPVGVNALDSYGDAEMTVTLQGPGIASPRDTIYGSSRSHGSSVSPPMTVLSQDVAVAISGPLEKELRTGSSSMELRRTTLQPDFLPVDWRGWLGADVVFLTTRELEQFPAEAREALRQWIALGGQLGLTGLNVTAADIQKLWPEADWKNGENGRLGVGNIHFVAQGTGDPDVKRMATLITDGSNNHDRLLKNIMSGYGRDFGMSEIIEGVDLNAPIILLFMVAFAVLVGPVNLFVFARGSKRYRIFWTTPLISIGTSLLLFVVILLQDGLGGRGVRLLVNVILPGQNEMVQVQEQVSRTGLLLNRTFDFSPEAAIFPVELGSGSVSSYGRTADNSTLSDLKLAYNSGGTQLTGDWFRSRSRQAQLLMNVEPSRARVEFLETDPGQPPRVLSNINERLETFYYFDGSQGWIARGLDPGTETVLQATDQAGKDLGVDITDLAGSWITHHLDQRTNQGAYYLAITERPDKDSFLKTLGSIRWSQEHALYFEFFPAENTGSGTAPQPEAQP